MNKIKEIIVFVIFGLILFSINSITKKNPSVKQKTTISLPINTVGYTRIESIQLLKKFIYNELFVVKDQLVFEKLKSIAENQDENDFSVSDLNIDMAAPIELININIDGENYSIIRMRSTEKGIGGKFSIPYFETEKEKCFLIEGNKKNIKSIKKQFLHSFNYSLTSRKDVAIFNFDNKKLVQSSRISVQKNQIKLVIHENQNKQQKQLLLKESGFHFSFPVEDGIQVDKQLQQIPILPKINFPFKDIRHISGNYSGFKFTENDSIIGIPKIDLLISFNQKMKVDSLILNLMKQLKVEFPIKNNQLSFGKEKLYFSQITPKIVYLSTQHTNPKLEKSNHPIKIAGDLSQLTKLENAGWKGMLIEVFPLFKSTKKLLEKTENVTFKKVNAKTYEISIPVKKNQNVFHEIVKFTLSTPF
jgi:hypothetical protein